MNSKRLLVGTVVGGIVVYALGYLIFNLLFGEFYTANPGSATGVDRDPDLVWAVAIGALAYGALITLAVGSRTGAGALAGAVVGFLLWCTADFTLYGITNVGSLKTTVVDPLLEGIRGGITGGVLALVIGKMK